MLPHAQGPAVLSHNTPILTPYLSLTWPSVSIRQCPVRAAYCARTPFFSLPWDLASQHLVWWELSAAHGCTPAPPVHLLPPALLPLAAHPQCSPPSLVASIHPSHCPFSMTDPPPHTPPPAWLANPASLSACLCPACVWGGPRWGRLTRAGEQHQGPAYVIPVVGVALDREDGDVVDPAGPQGAELVGGAALVHKVGAAEGAVSGGVGDRIPIQHLSGSLAFRWAPGDGDPTLLHLVHLEARWWEELFRVLVKNKGRRVVSCQPSKPRTPSRCQPGGSGAWIPWTLLAGKPLLAPAGDAFILVSGCCSRDRLLHTHDHTEASWRVSCTHVTIHAIFDLCAPPSFPVDPGKQLFRRSALG